MMIPGPQSNTECPVAYYKLRQIPTGPTGLARIKTTLNRLRIYGNGYSMAIVLDHRSTTTSLTGNVMQCDT